MPLHYIDVYDTEPLHSILPDSHFIAFKLIAKLKFNKSDFGITGLFVLTDDDYIISIASVNKFVIDCIYTRPYYRHMGYSKKLAHELVTFGLRANVKFVSPVDCKLVETAKEYNWLPLSTKPNPDGTIDMCHKLFHADAMLTYPNACMITSKTQFKAYQAKLNAITIDPTLLQ